MFPWLNIELTSRCNGTCSFCGRHKLRKKGWETGDMDFNLFVDIVSQLNPEKTQVLQFNKDGDVLLYPRLQEVGLMCSPFITNIVTNGKLLYDRKEDIVGWFDTLTVSVIENDQKQFDIVKKFLEWKGKGRPEVFIKFLGDAYNYEYEELGLNTMRRVIHNPKGDWDYPSEPLIPEIGVCLDLLFKPSISWKGKFHICNRFDPEGKGVIGDVTKRSLESIWYSEERDRIIKNHLKGKREGFCEPCQYWGIPRYV